MGIINVQLNPQHNEVSRNWKGVKTLPKIRYTEWTKFILNSVWRLHSLCLTKGQTWDKAEEEFGLYCSVSDEQEKRAAYLFYTDCVRSTTRVRQFERDQTSSDETLILPCFL